MEGNYKELRVWHKGIELAETVYEIIKQLPVEERFALADQMRRSAISVPSNIAEGYGRQTKKEFVQFLCIARGSLYELETQLILCYRLYRISPELQQKVSLTIFQLGKMLHALIVASPRS